MFSTHDQFINLKFWLFLFKPYVIQTEQLSHKHKAIYFHIYTYKRHDALVIMLIHQYAQNQIYWKCVEAH